MKKLILPFVFLMTYQFALAQTIQFDFEELTDTIDMVGNGSDGDSILDYGIASFPLTYDFVFGYWAQNFAWSSFTDTLTGDFTNLYSAIPGMGADSSLVYLVGQQNAIVKMYGNIPKQVQVTNSTYAYISMRDGDLFAKKFGGLSGNDPDYFVMTFYGYKDSSLISDTVNFYLADFRFTDNSLDYIIKDWTSVDLNILGDVDSIRIELRSSDIGAFGINTPLFYCLDNFQIQNGTLINESSEVLNLFPNPSSNHIYINNDFNHSTYYELYSLDGVLIKSELLHNNLVDITNIDKGTYLILINENNTRYHSKFIKQ